MTGEKLANMICNRLFNTQTKAFMSSSNVPIIAPSEREAVLEVVREVVSLATIDRIAELEAKVFVYEEIIKKSNFGPMYGSL